MKYPHNIWQQLKNKTAGELMKGLEKDGWVQDVRIGAQQIYLHEDGRRVSIHYHPHMTYGPNLLKALLEDIGWTVQDMKRLKLVK